MTIDAHTNIPCRTFCICCLLMFAECTRYSHEWFEGYQRTENKRRPCRSPEVHHISHRLFPFQFIMTTTTMKTLDDVARQIASKRRIVVLCGAGISVSCGIPDFRSANGLYQTLDLVSLDIDSPEVCLSCSFRKAFGLFYVLNNLTHNMVVFPWLGFIWYRILPGKSLEVL